MRVVTIDRYSSGFEVRLEGELRGTRSARSLALGSFFLGVMILAVGLPGRYKPGFLSFEAAMVIVGVASVVSAVSSLAAAVLNTMRPVNMIELADGRLRVRPGGGEPVFDSPLSDVTVVLADRFITLISGSEEVSVNARGHLGSSLVDVVEALEEAIAKVASSA